MPSAVDITQERIENALEKGLKALSEYDSRTIFEAYGIPVVKAELVQDAAQVEQCAKRLGYPVAIKACGAAFTHKSDRGLVRLNVDDPTSVAAAIEDIRKAAGKDAIDGYLVQPMLRGRREIIVGGMRNELFGPSVMLGLGGVLVEAIADIAFRLAPLDERDAQEMINNLRAHRLFDAVRGEPAVDRDTLIKVLIAVGQILIDHPRIVQIDANPIIFEGPQPVAVDALITLNPTQ